MNNGNNNVEGMVQYCLDLPQHLENQFGQDYACIKHKLLNVFPELVVCSDTSSGSVLQ